ncbi:hypothetical protein AGMMS49942_03390 [Spirochaetia bacterium]|nr:hypothetical protein AGMMS49942_03390 [Spirochaetia bacterium]
MVALRYKGKLTSLVFMSGSRVSVSRPPVFGRAGARSGDRLLPPQGSAYEAGTAVNPV